MKAMGMAKSKRRVITEYKAFVLSVGSFGPGVSYSLVALSESDWEALRSSINWVHMDPEVFKSFDESHRFAAHLSQQAEEMGKQIAEQGSEIGKLMEKIAELTRRNEELERELRF